jgi:wyosine [tRNA(Phe)-imidazoG37] synthetase (radical SAM superfamily)
LHSRLGWLIRQVKRSTSIPVAVITNGSLLHIPAVAQEVAAADAVLPTLDAGDAALYRRLNRPHPALTYDSLRQGLGKFRQHYEGLFWLEVMLVDGVNDSEAALRGLAAALDELEPDQIHVNVPFRASAEPWVRAPLAATVKRACEILGPRARLVPPASAGLEQMPEASTAALAEVIARHPVSATEVRRSFPELEGRSDEMINDAVAQRRLQKVQRHGEWFWCPAGGTYADLQAGKGASQSREHKTSPHKKGRHGGSL